MDIDKKINQINIKLNLKKFDEVISECTKLIKKEPNIGILYNIYCNFTLSYHLFYYILINMLYYHNFIDCYSLIFYMA